MNRQQLIEEITAALLVEKQGHVTQDLKTRLEKAAASVPPMAPPKGMAKPKMPPKEKQPPKAKGYTTAAKVNIQMAGNHLRATRGLRRGRYD